MLLLLLLLLPCAAARLEDHTVHAAVHQPHVIGPVAVGKWQEPSDAACRTHTTRDRRRQY